MKDQFKKAVIYKPFGLKSNAGTTSFGLKANHSTKQRFTMMNTQPIIPALQK